MRNKGFGDQRELESRGFRCPRVWGTQALGHPVIGNLRVEVAKSLGPKGLGTKGFGT